VNLAVECPKCGRRTHVDRDDGVDAWTCPGCLARVPFERRRFAEFVRSQEARLRRWIATR